MPVFPPSRPVTVSIDGQRLPAYVRAIVVRGRVYAPMSLLLRALVDRMWLEDGVLVVERDGRRVRVPLAVDARGDPDASFVAIGPLLRELGDHVAYDASERSLDVRTRPAGSIALPTPFDATAPAAPPRAVFTPQPVATPRPVWSGPPLPRRTPLPMPPRGSMRLPQRG